MEKTYAAISPLAFKSAQLVERLSGASTDEQQSRLGYVAPTAEPPIWFHGASAGEMAAASGLAAMLRAQCYRFESVYTAANRSGIDYIRRSDRRAGAVGLMPWDTAECIGRALERWRPRAIFLIETELWPRFVFEAARRAIPIFSVSARIYPADLGRYRAIKPFIAPTLRRITRILAQDDIERERFVQIGAPSVRCLSVGNLKYIRPHIAVHSKQSLARELGIEKDDRIIVFGSMHSGEAARSFDAIERMISRHARVIVAPRHLSSVESIAREAARRGINFGRRTNVSRAIGWRLLILDSMGELERIYALASCAIVGGGFDHHGGHNPFEPVIAGAPVAFGSHFFHFDSEARALTSVTPAAQISRIEELDQLLTNWLEDEALRLHVLQLQRSALPDSAAIAARYAAALEPWLSARGGHA